MKSLINDLTTCMVKRVLTTLKTLFNKLKYKTDKVSSKNAGQLTY